MYVNQSCSLATENEEATIISAVLCNDSATKVLFLYKESLKIMLDKLYTDRNHNSWCLVYEMKCIMLISMMLDNEQLIKNT